MTPGVVIGADGCIAYDFELEWEIRNMRVVSWQDRNQARLREELAQAEASKNAISRNGKAGV